MSSPPRLPEHREVRGGPLHIIAQTVGTVSELSLSGEIDVSSSSLLARELREAIGVGSELVVLDFGAVEFIDAAGMGVLAEAHRQLEASGRRLVVLDVQGEPARAFEVAGLANVLSFARSSTARRFERR